MLVSRNSIRCVWISLLFFSEIVADKDTFPSDSEDSSIVQNFPSREDLRVYLTSLERIINFSHNAFKEISNVDYSFGFHFVKVNLKPSSTDDSVPISLRYYLKSLLERNEVVMNTIDKKFNNPIHKYLSSTWRGPLKLNFVLPRKRRFQIKQSQMYPDWNVYAKIAMDFKNFVPSPQMSDKCLISSLNNPQNKLRNFKLKCNVPDFCHSMLINGSNFGYALTHRLLYLMVSNFGCGCNVFSTEQDQTMRHIFCNIIHTEAEYIAHNNWNEMKDLFMEQIALCTLNGHAEFLRHSWLTDLLRSQTPHGCFTLKPPSKTNDPPKHTILWKLTNHLMNGTCNGHLTSLAAGMTSAAVRFILEQY